MYHLGDQLVHPLVCGWHLLVLVVLALPWANLGGQYPLQYHLQQLLIYEFFPSSVVALIEARPMIPTSLSIKLGFVSLWQLVFWI